MVLTDRDDFGFSTSMAAGLPALQQAAKQRPSLSATFAAASHQADSRRAAAHDGSRVSDITWLVSQAMVT